MILDLDETEVKVLRGALVAYRSMLEGWAKAVTPEVYRGPPALHPVLRATSRATRQLVYTADRLLAQLSDPDDEHQAARLL